METTPDYVFSTDSDLLSTDGTGNGTTGTLQDDVAGFYRENRGTLIFMMTFISLNSLLAIGGNGLVIYLILTRPFLRNSGNIFLANLAVTDILYGVMEVVMVRRTIDKYHHPETARFYPNEPWLCKLEGVIISCLLTGSVHNLTAIAVNRYIRVCRNERYTTMCSKAVVIMVAFAIWPLSVLLALPPVFMHTGGMIYNHVFATCMFDQENNVFQQMFLGCVGFMFPSAVIVQSYLLIYKKVKQSKTKLHTHQTAGGHEVEKGHANASQQVLSRFLAFCSFMVLWMPYSVVGMVNMFVFVPNLSKIYTGMLVCVSSSINPILYGLFNSHFKKEYLRLARKLIILRRGNIVHIQNSTTGPHTRESRV